MANDTSDEIEADEIEVERVEICRDPVTPPVGPPVAPGDEIEEELVPVRVVERERVERGPDGTLERRLDRVEHAPVRRRRRMYGIGPVLLLILALALGAIAAAWYFTRSDEKPVTNVVGLQADDAVSRLQDDGFKADIFERAGLDSTRGCRRKPEPERWNGSRRRLDGRHRRLGWPGAGGRSQHCRYSGGGRPRPTR